LTILVPAPASHRPVRPHATRVTPAGADGGELALGRRGLTVFVIAPADHSAVALQRAVMAVPGADRDVLSLGRSSGCAVLAGNRYDTGLSTTGGLGSDIPCGLRCGGGRSRRGSRSHSFASGRGWAGCGCGRNIAGISTAAGHQQDSDNDHQEPAECPDNAALLRFRRRSRVTPYSGNAISADQVLLAVTVRDRWRTAEDTSVTTTIEHSPTRTA